MSTIKVDIIKKAIHSYLQKKPPRSARSLRVAFSFQWEPNNEIEQVDFFARSDLPSQLHPWNVKRIEDAFNNKVANLHIFN
ncbi:hypothetical protein [Lederbergia citrea]|uniref:Uncharacterized protein n=1 Tax=Lederbergia citrea TaxID=2833581 RepID=A0A942UJM6_9BACI|nr:hypothetical protein [Lederbergia citrea]MBS4176863.1 hypothetical protein [Lederbergia citrea]MBS4203426.1 hypothetical protein [Lederbergia citrea]MBS4221900.1 hypothetical protein [Lederbergia citrea]